MNRGRRQRRMEERRIHNLRRVIPRLNLGADTAGAAVAARPPNPLTEAVHILLVIWPRAIHRCCACLYTGAALVTGLFSMLLVLASVVVAVVSLLWMGLWGAMDKGWQAAAVCLIVGILAGPWMAPAIVRKYDHTDGVQQKQERDSPLVRAVYRSTHPWFGGGDDRKTPIFMFASAAVVWGLYLVVWVLGHYVVLGLARRCKRWMVYVLLMGFPTGGEAHPLDDRRERQGPKR
jgi:hypothetical protein